MQRNDAYTLLLALVKQQMEGGRYGSAMELLSKGDLSSHIVKGECTAGLAAEVARSYVQAMDIEYRIRPEESLISAFQELYIDTGAARQIAAQMDSAGMELDHLGGQIKPGELVEALEHQLRAIEILYKSGASCDTTDAKTGLTCLLNAYASYAESQRPKKLNLLHSIFS